MEAAGVKKAGPDASEKVNETFSAYNGYFKKQLVGILRDLVRMGVAAGEGRGGNGCSACQKSIAMLFPVSECECVGGVDNLINICTFYSFVLLA